MAAANDAEGMSSEDNADTAVAFLSLPIGSVVSIDGQTVFLKRDDFVGFHGIPTSNNSFHFVTVRAASTANRSNPQTNQVASAVTNAYIIPAEKILVRQFDQRTEEISCEPVDKLTELNLLRQIQENGLGVERLVPYSQLLCNEKKAIWHSLTNFISKHLLEGLNIRGGDKLIAGSLGEEETPSTTGVLVDGRPVYYPSIPIMCQRNSRHAGMKRFMVQLSPTERTALCMDPSSSDRILEHVLDTSYRNQYDDLLGDIQFAFVVFLHLHCFSSLEHWRDLLALLSFATKKSVFKHSDLFAGLLQVLSVQVTVVDTDFFEDAELSGENFLVPALRRLTSTISCSLDNALASQLGRLTQILESRFPGSFGDSVANTSDDEDGTLADDVDDTDGPVVVSNEEMEASIARSSKSNTANEVTVYSSEIRNAYPILFAAMIPPEDVLMTCARALYDASDVSLVREAAAYLEQVESAVGPQKDSK
jgi:AAR2 protein